MKKTFWGSLVASLLMSASLFAADCARVNTPLADGDILYAANYEGELNNLITCVNERVETIGDTLTGNLTFNGGGLRIWSGNNFNIYSDTGVTSTFSVSGSSGNIVSSGTLVVSGNSTFDTNTLFVDATNNRVGILTTSPADKLHIVATSDAEEVSRITASGTGASLTTQIYNSDSSKRFLNRYDFGTDLYTLQSDSGVILAMNRNGDVGIRSTKKFSYDSSSLSGNTYQTESSSDVFDTVVGGANAMRITTSDVKILNGLDLNIYSDSGSSLKFSVDSATGNAGIPLGQKLYFDGAGLSGNSWITSNSFFMTFNHQISGSQGFAFNGLISGTPTTLFQVSGVGAVTNAYFATSLATSGSAANLYMDSGTGQIFRSTSSIKYKKKRLRFRNRYIKNI